MVVSVNHNGAIELKEFVEPISNKKTTRELSEWSKESYKPQLSMKFWQHIQY